MDSNNYRGRGRGNYRSHSGGFNSQPGQSQQQQRPLSASLAGGDSDTGDWRRPRLMHQQNNYRGGLDKDSNSRGGFQRNYRGSNFNPYRGNFRGSARGGRGRGGDAFYPQPQQYSRHSDTQDRRFMNDDRRLPMVNNSSRPSALYPPRRPHQPQAFSYNEPRDNYHRSPEDGRQRLMSSKYDNRHNEDSQYNEGQRSQYASRSSSKNRDYNNDDEDEDDNDHNSDSNASDQDVDVDGVVQDETTSRLVSDNDSTNNDEDNVDDVKDDAKVENSSNLQTKVADKRKEKPDGFLEKEEITAQMDKLDDNISKLETMLDKIRLRSVSVEDLTDGAKNESAGTKDSQKVEAKQRETSAQLVDRIYKENRARAVKGQADMLAALKYQQDDHAKQNLPVKYFAPSDLPIYHETIARFKTFKAPLMKFLARQKQEQAKKVIELQDEYSERYEEWRLEVAEYESSHPRPTKKKSRRNELREGEYDGVNVPDGYMHPDDDFRYLKTLALIPPMIIGEKARHSVSYIDKNRSFEDSTHLIRQNSQLNPWTEAEKEKFVQIYLESPKEFGRIASFLPNKNANDCVLFYYLNKKSLKLKAQMKQALTRSRRRRKQQQMSYSEEDLRASNEQQGRQMSMEDEGLRHSVTSRAQSIEAQQEDSVPEIDLLWSTQEVELAKNAFREYGLDYHKIAEYVGTRTIGACRRLYADYFDRLGEDLTRNFTPINHENNALLFPPKEEKEKKKRGRKPNTPADARPVDRPLKVNTEDADGSNSAPGSPNTDIRKDVEKRRTVSYWTTKEKADFVAHFGRHGKNWKALSEAVGTKTETQIRNYFQNHKVALGLVPAGEEGAADAGVEGLRRNTALGSILNADGTITSETLLTHRNREPVFNPLQANEPATMLMYQPSTFTFGNLSYQARPGIYAQPFQYAYPVNHGSFSVTQSGPFVPTSAPYSPRPMIPRIQPRESPRSSHQSDHCDTDDERTFLQNSLPVRSRSLSPQKTPKSWMNPPAGAVPYIPNVATGSLGASGYRAEVDMENWGTKLPPILGGRVDTPTDEMEVDVDDSKTEQVNEEMEEGEASS